MEAPPLFSLVPYEGNPEATAVVDENPSFRDEFNGQRGLSFTLEWPYKVAGRLVSFGRNPNDNDVCLPGRFRDERYYSHHFYFYLAPSGELVLQDESPGKGTELEVHGVATADRKLYNLKGTPRRRVIPRVAGLIIVRFGKYTAFEFAWRVSLDDGITNRLAEYAYRLAVPGMTVTCQEEVDGSPEELLPRRRALRSHYTVTTVPRPGPIRDIHRYSVLGEGGFGIVYKVVDLSLGAVWAVKEMKPDTQGNWSSLETMKTEVERLATLRNPNIVHFERFQDFCLGGRFQIFLRLYEGSLADLLPAHSCVDPPPRANPPWTWTLIEDVLSALHYLQDENVVHQDIKPSNILYDSLTGDGTEPRFYLADFGLGKLETCAAAHGAAGRGTPFYMAPEQFGPGAVAVHASDTWAFAITLGCVLGYWCYSEPDLTADDWNRKLASLGVANPPPPPPPSHNQSKQQRWFRRIWSLVDNQVLPPMFTNMLARVDLRATPAACLQASTDEFTAAPQIRNRNPVGTPDADSSSSIATWHIRALIPDGMSIDVPQGGYSRQEA